MSAIAAIFHFDGRPQAAADLARMMRALALLGPDRESSWQDGDVALGFRQMALLPEDRFDRQPWRGQGGVLVMVANARLDNRDELAGALAIAPDLARAMADSEMLLRAYEIWGEAALERLVGAFVFIAWHVRERRLFCARSQLEGPTLYFHRTKRFFACATTADALFTLSDVPRCLNEERLALQLALLPRQGEAYYRDIFSLPPAHYLSVAPDRLNLRRYWRLDLDRHVTLPSDDEYAEALREIFDRAVSARLRSIHPIGSHLSSGLDSSAVTVTAARHLAAEGKGLTAFTAAPRENYSGLAPFGRLADESPLAATTARPLANVAHVIVRSGRGAALDGLDRSYFLAGRPLLNPVNGPWIDQILDEARRRHIRVLLTGQMGNMSISYDGWPRLAGLLRTGHWLTLLREAIALRRAGWGPYPIAARVGGPYLPRWLRRGLQQLRGRPGNRLSEHSAINPTFAQELDIDAMARARNWDTSHRPWADGRAMRRAVLEQDDLADHGNAALAGWGIDQRDPTHDQRVVEFCLAIPEDQYLRAGETRRIYRRVFGAALPAAVLNARHKGFQAADWHERLIASRAEIAAELDRLERSPLARRILNLPRLRRLVEDWPDGGWHRPEIVRHYRAMLLRGVSMGKFIRWVEGGND